MKTNLIWNFQPVFACILSYLSFIGWGWILSRLVQLKGKADFGILGAWALNSSDYN